MSPSEVEGCMAEMGRQWPRVMSAKGWTKDEKILFSERAARVQCSQEQAIAAIQEYKATEDKFPTVAGILKRLRRLNPTGTISPARGPEGPTLHPVLAHMVRRLRHQCLPIPTEHKAIVANYWVMVLTTTADLLGFVPEDRFDGIYRDVMTIWHDDHERADAAREWLIGQFADRLTPPANPTEQQRRAAKERGVKKTSGAGAGEHA